MNRLFVNLDKTSFMNVHLWEFGFRSLPREYSRLFLFRAVLAHPLRAVRGLRGYQKFIDKHPAIYSQYRKWVIIPDETAFLEKIRKRREMPLVGLGFCLKPYDLGKVDHSCPSGRANHNCLYLERGETWPVCTGCSIFKIADRCFKTGCRVYIMTSAKDIAEDFMLPQIEQGAFPAAILILCAYSVQAIILPLLICGVDMFLLSYERGDCRDYGEWLMADRGIKDELTCLGTESWQKLTGILDKLEADGLSKGLSPVFRRFRREGNIYYPE